MVYRIYTLACPTSNDVKYIGVTTKSLIERLQVHVADSKILYNARAKWVKELFDKGLRPIIELLEEVTEDWEILERYWISQFKTWGFSLTNSTEGGKGPLGIKYSNESRRKMSEWQKGRKRPETAIIKFKKTIKANNSSKKTPEWRLKISKANKGKVRTEEYKKALSEKMKGNKYINNTKAVSQLSKMGEFINTYESITEAHKATGVCISSISSCLSNKYKTAGGYKWVETKNSHI